MSVKGDGQWVKLNAGQHVPLRVKYPDSMIPALCEAVKAKAVGGRPHRHPLDIRPHSRRLGSSTPRSTCRCWPRTLPRTTRRCGVWYSSSSRGCTLLVGGGAPELLGLFDTFARSLLLPKLAELGWTPATPTAT